MALRWRVCVVYLTAFDVIVSLWSPQAGTTALASDVWKEEPSTNERKLQLMTDDIPVDAYSRRPRRSVTVSFVTAILDKLNGLRRTVSAGNMYYTSWDNDLAEYAASLTSSCRLQSQSSVDIKSSTLPLQKVNGLTGYVSSRSGIPKELQRIFDQGPLTLPYSFYSQIMASHLIVVGCDVGDRLCNVNPGTNLPQNPFVPATTSDNSSEDSKSPIAATKNATTTQATTKATPTSQSVDSTVSTISNSSYVYACIFGYTQGPSSVRLYTLSNQNCSLCDPDAILCNNGLCQVPCSSPFDPSCGQTCQQTCSSCSTVLTSANCSCLCSYSNNQYRCHDGKITSSTMASVCSLVTTTTAAAAAATATTQLTTATLSTSLSSPMALTTWLTLTVVICVLLLLVISLLAFFVRRRLAAAAGRRQSRESRSSAAVESTETSARVTSQLDVIGAEPVSVVMLPPAYADILEGNVLYTRAAVLKPPEYWTHDLPPSYNENTDSESAATSVSMASGFPIATPVSSVDSSLENDGRVTAVTAQPSAPEMEVAPSVHTNVAFNADSEQYVADVCRTTGEI